MARKTYTKEEITKRLDTLPPEIKNLLYTEETENIIQQVGVKNRLHIDQTAMLMAEANEVMCGFAESKEFVPNLMETLQIDRTKADAVAQDVNDLLFNKIRDSMKKVYEQNAAPAPVAPQNPPAMSMEKSVVMPSQTATTPVPVKKVEQSLPAPGTASAPAATTVPVQPKPVVPPTPAPTTPPAAPAAIPKVDAMLSEATVSLPNKVEEPAKNEVPKPAQAPIYKADPYREPPE